MWLVLVPVRGVSLPPSKPHRSFPCPMPPLLPPRGLASSSWCWLLALLAHVTLGLRVCD